MTVTSFDVAKAAGVSQSTVSRALNDSPSISAHTIRRVKETAAALNYVPSDRARELSTRRTMRVAMIVDLDNPLWSLLVGRTYDLLAARRYRLSLIAEHGDALEIENHLLGGSVDGVVISAVTLQSGLPERLVERGLPVVLLHRFSASPDIDSSVADDRSGGRIAAQILLDAGHTDIGALFGAQDTSTGLERETGFRSTLDDAGVTLAVDAVRNGNFTLEYGATSVREMVEKGTLPRALFCANDTVALGAMNAAREHGLRVPDDLALVGFDDLEASAWPMIQLTTVHVPFEEMLKSAISLLTDEIEQKQPAEHRLIHPVHAVLRSTHLRS